MLERDGATLANFITHGIDDRERALIGAPPHGEGLLGEDDSTRQPLRVEDLTTHPGRSGFPAHHPAMHQFLGVPVVVEDGTVFGNLYLTDHVTGEPFSAEDEDLLAGFGRAAGLVIDQATLRDQLRELSVAEERERLARDLHDTVIQRLFGIGLSLRLTLGGELDDAIRERIDQALDELNETIHDIRTTIFEIDSDRERPRLARGSGQDPRERGRVATGCARRGSLDVGPRRSRVVVVRASTSSRPFARYWRTSCATPAQSMSWSI